MHLCIYAIYINLHLSIYPCIYASMCACLPLDREDASSMVTAGATANTTEGNSRASRESGLLCSHSHGESIALALAP